MKLTTDIKEKLHYYINNKEVVYQSCGELVEVSNDTKKENKDTLLGIQSVGFDFVFSP